LAEEGLPDTQNNNNGQLALGTGDRQMPEYVAVLLPQFRIRGEGPTYCGLTFSCGGSIEEEEFTVERRRSHLV
jgi:hypothetical protein